MLSALIETDNGKWDIRLQKKVRGEFLISRKLSQYRHIIWKCKYWECKCWESMKNNSHPCFVLKFWFKKQSKRTLLFFSYFEICFFLFFYLSEDSNVFKGCNSVFLFFIKMTKTKLEMWKKNLFYFDLNSYKIILNKSKWFPI